MQSPPFENLARLTFSLRNASLKTGESEPKRLRVVEITTDEEEEASSSASSLPLPLAKSNANVFRPIDRQNEGNEDKERRQQAEDILKESAQTGRISPSAGFLAGLSDATTFHMAAARANLVSPTTVPPTTVPPTTVPAQQQIQTTAQPTTQGDKSLLDSRPIDKLQVVLFPGRQQDSNLYFNSSHPDSHTFLCDELVSETHATPSLGKDILTILVKSFIPQSWILWWLDVIFPILPNPAFHPLVVVLEAYGQSDPYQNCMLRENAQRRRLVVDKTKYVGGIEPPEDLVLDNLELLVLSYMKAITLHHGYIRMSKLEHLFAIAKVEAGPQLAQMYIERFLQDHGNFLQKVPESEWPTPDCIGAKYLCAYSPKNKIDLLAACALQRNRALTLFLLDYYSVCPSGAIWKTEKTPFLTTAIMIWFEYFCSLQAKISMPSNILCGLPVDYKTHKAKQTEVLGILFKMMLVLENLQDEYPYKTYMMEFNESCAKYMFEFFSYLSALAEKQKQKDQDKESWNSSSATSSATTTTTTTSSSFSGIDAEEDDIDPDDIAETKPQKENNPLPPATNFEKTTLHRDTPPGRDFAMPVELNSEKELDSNLFAV